jgi:hypothetical protein
MTADCCANARRDAASERSPFHIIGCVDSNDDNYHVVMEPEDRMTRFARISRDFTYATSFGMSRLSWKRLQVSVLIYPPAQQES